MVKQETGEAASGSNQSVPKAAVKVKQEPLDDSGALRTLKRKSEPAGTGGDGVKQENDSKKVKLEEPSGDASGKKKKKKKKKRSKNKGPKGRPAFDQRKWEEDHKSLLECTYECQRGARERCQQCEVNLLVYDGEYPQMYGWKQLDSGLWISREFSIQNDIGKDLWQT